MFSRLLASWDIMPDMVSRTTYIPVLESKKFGSDFTSDDKLSFSDMLLTLRKRSGHMM